MPTAESSPIPSGRQQSPDSETVPVSLDEEMKLADAAHLVGGGGSFGEAIFTETKFFIDSEPVERATLTDILSFDTRALFGAIGF